MIIIANYIPFVLISRVVIKMNSNAMTAAVTDISVNTHKTFEDDDVAYLEESA